MRVGVSIATALIAVTVAVLTPRALAREPDNESAERESQGKDIETVTVTATRSGKRVQDEPIHVEIIDREEISEASTMTPGQVGHILGETSGIHLQVTSPSLGAANLAIEGLKGHYTQILSDGLPIFGAQTESLGVLQIPPSDLDHVEVIKGVASALYGPSALGGVVDLISRRPGTQFSQEYLLNATSVDGQDMVGFLSGPVSKDMGFTLSAGLHRQGQSDLDHDGWADIPAYSRAVVRPRLYWDDGDGDSIFFTTGLTEEGRQGGTIAGQVAPDGKPFPQRLDTERFDAGIVARFLTVESVSLDIRASAVNEQNSHVWGDVRDRDAHRTWFGELALTGDQKPNTWTIGAAIEADAYRSRNFSAFDYTYSVPAIFVQDEYEAADWLTLAASARVDFHNKYGTFISPRLSALARFDEWTARATVGLGNYAPTPFTEETADTGLSRLSPLSGIKAERARAASLDLGRQLGPVEFNGSIFGSIIDHPVRLTQKGPSKLSFANQSGPVRTVGGELSAVYREDPVTVTGGYVYLDSTEIDPQTGQREEVELTPKNAIRFDIALEEEDLGRMEFEGLYTGRQSLNNPLDPNPYRSESAPYVLFGFLAEWYATEHVGVFANVENITDVRQTHYDQLLRPTQAVDGRWTVDEWAPLDGRVINAGIRARF